MNYNTELNLTHSKSKARWWRMGLIWGFIFTFGIINFGCDKGCETAIDEYYVKFEVNSFPFHNSRLYVTINTENNEDMTIIITQEELWETIIGPVQKGFNASMEVSSPYYDLQLYTNIYVSKNDSPFALKKSEGSDILRDSIQISYTIDY